MKEPQLINHQGKSIFYMDFSGLREFNEIKHVVSKSIEYIRSQPEKSVLTLTNLDGIHFNTEIKNLFVDFISGNKPHIKASSVIGMTGLGLAYFKKLISCLLNYSVPQILNIKNLQS